MTEAEVIQITRVHIEGKFPKRCRGCGREFASLREYLQQTEHVGPPRPYDAEFGNWTPARPIGTASYARCACGHTLCIDSGGMSIRQLWRLLTWLRTESKQRQLTPRQLLSHVREEIDRQVLADPSSGKLTADG